MPILHAPPSCWRLWTLLRLSGPRAANPPNYSARPQYRCVNAQTSGISTIDNRTGRQGPGDTRASPSAPARLIHFTPSQPDQRIAVQPSPRLLSNTATSSSVSRISTTLVEVRHPRPDAPQTSHTEAPRINPVHYRVSTAELVTEGGRFQCAPLLRRSPHPSW